MKHDSQHEVWHINKRKMSEDRKKAVASLKNDLYKLLVMVGNSKKVSSFKIHPGETINVILYEQIRSTGQEVALGEFPLQLAISYLLGEALSDGKDTVISED